MLPDNILPLQGLRVVEISQIWAGPQLCSSLGDMGAEVVRIESRAGTDQVRFSEAEKGEYRVLLESQRHARSRSYYISLNVASSEGKEIFKEIITTADLFVCNLSPKALRKLGLTYEDLRPYRPDLVMATISATGSDGPWSDLVAFGPSMNAVMGSDSLVGYPDTGELMASYWDPDPTMGVMGFYAVMLALYHRQETGEGQHIDLAFSEQLVDLISEPVLEYQMRGVLPKPRGNRHPRMAPHQIYPCLLEDTWVSIAVSLQTEWQALCIAIGQPGLASDPRFAETDGRLTHLDELDDIISEWTRGYTNTQATEILQAVGVAATPAFGVAEAYHDPHDIHRRTSINLETTDLPPDLVTYGIPWRLSLTPGSVRRLGQTLGYDNHSFLTEMLGFRKSQLDQLTKGHVLY